LTEVKSRVYPVYLEKQFWVNSRSCFVVPSKVQSQTQIGDPSELVSILECAQFASFALVEVVCWFQFLFCFSAGSPIPWLVLFVSRLQFPLNWIRVVALVGPEIYTERNPWLIFIFEEIWFLRSQIYLNLKWIFV